MHLVLTGVAIGLLASAALTRLLAGMLFEIEPLDPTTFAATSLALLTIATLAAYIPARAACEWLPSTRSETKTHIAVAVVDRRSRTQLTCPQTAGGRAWICKT